MSIPPVEQCPVQGFAAARVSTQVKKLNERLLQNAVIPIFTFELYAVNCERHGEPANHVELATTPLDDLKPEGLTQVILAMEACITQLKARTA